MQDISIIEKCVTMVKSMLNKNSIQISGPDAITRLCVTQPHMHKKGIMFTSFIFSFAISDLLGIKFVWTSDSDSMVCEETISTTIQTIDGDEKCGGASTTLKIHNRKDNLITTLGNTVYLNDFHLSRCFSSAAAANDCQSGPCAAFRINAIRPELLAWYNQTILGRWMVSHHYFRKTHGASVLL
jgi:hyaluronan synthase